MAAGRGEDERKGRKGEEEGCGRHAIKALENKEDVDRSL